jgi:hypothetical protein
MAAIDGDQFVCSGLLILTAILSSCKSKTHEPSPGQDTAALASPAQTAAVPGSPANTRVPEASTLNEVDAAAPETIEDIAEQLRVAGLTLTEAKSFLDTLKTRTAGRDRAGMCSLVSYPLEVHGKRGNQKIATEASCVAGYDRIFSASVLKAISEQRVEDLAAGSNGVMIGDGAIWFAAICTDLRCQPKSIKIISINN